MDPLGYVVSLWNSFWEAIPDWLAMPLMLAVMLVGVPLAASFAIWLVVNIFMVAFTGHTTGDVHRH